MSLRRYAPLAVGLAIVACKNVHQQSPPDTLTYAAFPVAGTPDASLAPPIPNDLVLQQAATVPGAQGQLLQSFVAAGGWPNDQEVPIQIIIRTLHRNAQGFYPVGPPADLDLSTVNDSTVAVVRVDQGQRQVVPIDTKTLDYTKSADFGTLTIRLQPAADGSRHWAAGARYVVALRGWPDGIKTTSGASVGAAQPIALIAPDKNLAIPENQPSGGLPPAQVQQLEFLRGLYANPLTWCSVGGTWTPQPPNAGICPPVSAAMPNAYAAIDAVFPHAEAMTIQTFGIEPGTHVAGDPGAGQIPFPSDFLLDPTTGKVRNLPAVFGAAAPGLATLDGFSTTGLLLAPTTAPIDALTVSRPNVLLVRLTSGPVPLCDVASAGREPGCSLTNAAYLSQPPQLDQTVGGATVSNVIGLAPAVPVPLPGNAGLLTLPPLDPKSQYAVIVTDRVKDALGRPLTRGTLGKILFTVTDPLVDANDNPTIAGLSKDDAKGLQLLRTGLAPLLAALPTLSGDSTLTADHVVMAYTVKTQTVTDVMQQLAAVPYLNPTASVVFVSGPTSTFDASPYGPHPDVDEYLATTVKTLNGIDPTTGAFYADLATRLGTTAGAAALLEDITALVAVPTASNASAQPNCPGTTNVRCVPLVVFQHGINGGHWQLIPVANALAKKGFVVAGIDAPYHGDRAFCMDNAQCASGGTCTPDPAKAGEGDAIPPGTCSTSLLFDPTKLTTAASGNYFVTANFFRIRDGIRQMSLDHAALVLALARPPAPFPPASDPLKAALLAKGLAIDPTRVYYLGVSLGSMEGVDLVASNPRYSRALLNVPGATLTDVFTTAPAFQQEVDQIFLSLGIDRSKLATDPAMAAKYLQTLTVAKWVLDPADPLNYARFVKTKLTPNLLADLGPLASTTTDVADQLAKCDLVVPNSTTVDSQGRPVGAWGEELLGNIGIPASLYSSTGTPGGCVDHGFLLEPTKYGTLAQDQAAAFLDDPTANPIPATVDLP